jgi:SAM-dependent methyltransferase
MGSETEQAFTRQAHTFEDGHLNHVLTHESEWAFAQLPRERDDLVLDVAAGTGLGSRALAAEVRAVVALDVTEAMLETGRRATEAAGLRNVVFMRGDAAALPFLDGSFSTVLCRYALHHFRDVEAPMAEMARVLRPYGKLAVADMVVDERPEVAAAANEIERLRDRSHAGALSASALQDLIVRHGLEATRAETRQVRRPLEPWLEQSGASEDARAEIERRLLAEIDGGAPTGLQPRREPGGTLTFVHTLTSVFALKPGP